MIRTASLVLAVFAFAMPSPPALAADGNLIIFGGCGNRALSVTIPFDSPAEPAGDGGCCDSAACHVGCERQKHRPRRS